MPGNSRWPALCYWSGWNRSKAQHRKPNPEKAKRAIAEVIYPKCRPKSPKPLQYLIKRSEGLSLRRLSARPGNEVMCASYELEAYIDESIRRSTRRGYYPTVFRRMRDQHGTVAAISMLVESGEVQSGFKRLKKLGLIEWSIEAAVVKFPECFTSRARECAEFRLKLARDEISLT